MATSTEIAADMRRTFKSNALDIGQVCEYLGMGRTQIKGFLVDVPSVRTGAHHRKKRYLVIDLARKMAHNTIVDGV